MEFLAAVPDDKAIPVYILTVEVVLQKGKNEFEHLLREKLEQHKKKG